MKAKVKHITIEDKIYIAKGDVDDVEQLQSLYSYPSDDEFLTTLIETEDYYCVPSNSYNKLEWDTITDNRHYEKLDHQLSFSGKLRYEQQEAVDKFFVGDRARSGLLQAPPGFGKCKPTSSLILTSNGLLSLEELQTDYNTEVINNTGTYPIIDYYDNGYKECYEVVTNYGPIVTGTGKHPVLVWNSESLTQEFKRIEDLKVGDYLLGMYDTNIFGSTEIEDPYLVGLLIGDGSLTLKNKIGFASADAELQNYFTDKFPNTRVYPKDNHIEYVVTDYSLYSKYVLNYNINCKSMHKTPNKTLRSLTREQTILLLRGLFDTDGSALNNGYIEYSSSSKNLAYFVFTQLMNLGIFCRIYKNYTNKEDSFRIVIISSYFCNKFYNTVGFTVMRKQERQKWLKEGGKLCAGSIPNLHKLFKEEFNTKFKNKGLSDYFRNDSQISLKRVREIIAAVKNAKLDSTLLESYANLFAAKVESINNIGVLPTADISIADNSHSYLSESIINHNTFASCSLLARNNAKSLILVHTKLLFEQWITELKTQIPNATIGRIGDGKYSLGDITVAIYKTAYNNLDKLKNEFSTIVLDECLDYEALITTRTGSEKIGKIVNNKLTPEVLCFNEEQGVFEYKCVYDWFKNKQETFLHIQTGESGGLKCTENHMIYVFRDKIIKIPANQVLVGDYVLANKQAKTNLVLKESTIPILLGLTVGDGCLDTDRGNITRVRLTHGEAQEEYLRYKMSMLNSFFVANVNTGRSGYKAGNTIKQVSSRSFVDNFDIVKSLYGVKTNKNCISKEIANYFNAITWALFYQDDGSLDRGQITFSVCELDLVSCNNLIESLNRLFNINDAYVFTSSRGYNYIRLKSKSARIFLAAISKYVHPSMSYKVIDYDKEAFESIFIEKPFEDYSLRLVTNITSSKSTYGNRYNISVEGNHNYLANNILVGNCHKAPADMFSHVLNNLNAKVKIGLSATPRRKDGKHVYLPDFFSPYLVVARDSRNLAIPAVTIVKTDFKFTVLDPKKEWARAMNTLCADEAYLKLIAEKAISYIKQRRCPLIIGDRVEMLKTLQKMIPNSICVIGESSNEIREDALEGLGTKYKAILTTKLFDEGISCHRLDTLFFTCPSNNPIQWEQRIGRIERLHPEKQFPLIVDFWLSGGIVSRQQTNRLLWYTNKGYKIL